MPLQPRNLVLKILIFGSQFRILTGQTINRFLEPIAPLNQRLNNTTQIPIRWNVRSGSAKSHP